MSILFDAYDTSVLKLYVLRICIFINDEIITML